MKILQNKRFFRCISLVVTVLGTALVLFASCLPLISLKYFAESMVSVIFTKWSGNVICNITVILFTINMVIYVLSIFILLSSIKRGKLSIILSFICVFVSVIGMLFSFSYRELSEISIFYVLTTIVFGAELGFNITYLKDKEEEEPCPARITVANAIITGLSVMIAIVLLFLTFRHDKEGLSINVIKVLTEGGNLRDFIISLVFFAITVGFIGCSLINLRYLRSNAEKSSKTTCATTYGLTIFTLIMFLSVTIIGFFEPEANMSSATILIPFILSSVCSLTYSFLFGGFGFDKIEKKKSPYKLTDVIPYIFVVIFTALVLIAMLTDILEVRIDGDVFTRVFRINGYSILAEYKTLGNGYRLMAFIVFFILMTLSAMFLISTVMLLTKSKFFKKMSIINIIICYLFLLALGLFGKYYEIAQKMTQEDLMSLVARSEYGGFATGIISSIKYTVTSNTYIYFIVATAFMIALIIIHPYKNMGVEEVSVNFAEDAVLNTKGDDTNVETATASLAESVTEYDFDACPAFTEIDSEKDKFEEANALRAQNPLSDPSLSELVDFAVTYARDSRLHLSYSKEDMAQFVAGLGATKLTILQGMSGTGKTSLPKIFIEAIMGNCEIVEVESSWKDKNELLGYYNEFSKIYTPKKFTQALYKARFNQNNIYFIVLDEMNLSRIEYYFSDFLSLMENEEDKREIKLLNVKLKKKIESESFDYDELKDGHTIQIPKNIWFIGTANRDESTFEISDKVYDRANTMNFNKRAPKVKEYGEVKSPRFLSYTEFRAMLDAAKSSVDFDIDSYGIFADVEKILSKYNISFGNRISRQMEDFVKVYISCFDNPKERINEAVEKILLSKVVAKLEYKSIEDKDALVKSFSKLGLNDCAVFLSKLNEDF